MSIVIVIKIFICSIHRLQFMRSDILFFSQIGHEDICEGVRDFDMVQMLGILDPHIGIHDFYILKGSVVAFLIINILELVPHRWVNFLMWIRSENDRW